MAFYHLTLAIPRDKGLATKIVEHAADNLPDLLKAIHSQPTPWLMGVEHRSFRDNGEQRWVSNETAISADHIACINRILPPESLVAAISERAARVAELKTRQPEAA